MKNYFQAIKLFCDMADIPISWKQISRGIPRSRKFADDRANCIKWIDILLETPIVDYRKNAIKLILAPYLINIKKLPYSNAFDIIKDWINKCDSLRRLDSNSNYRIKSALEDAIQKGIPPMSLAKLRGKIGSCMIY